MRRGATSTAGNAAEAQRDGVQTELRALASSQRRIETAIAGLSRLAGGQEGNMRRIEAEMASASAMQRSAEQMLRDLTRVINVRVGPGRSGSGSKSPTRNSPAHLSREDTGRSRGPLNETFEESSTFQDDTIPFEHTAMLEKEERVREHSGSAVSSQPASRSASLDFKPTVLTALTLTWADKMPPALAPRSASCARDAVKRAQTHSHSFNSGVSCHIDGLQSATVGPGCHGCHSNPEENLEEIYSYDDDPTRGSAIVQATLSLQAEGREVLLNAAGAPMCRGKRVDNDADCDGSFHYYCGRLLGEDILPGTDGRCGPDYGPQCPDCQAAQASIQHIGMHDEEDEDNVAITSIIQTIKKMQVLPVWQTEVRSNIAEGRGKSIFGMAASMPAFMARSDPVLRGRSRYFDWLVLQPYSRRRTVWDILSILLITIDFIVVPLMFFEDFSISEIWLFTSTAFWTADIPMAMFTGYQVREAVELRLHRAVRRYVTSWLVVDLLVTVPMWVEVGARLKGDESMPLLPRIGNVKRLLRFLRLLRLLKLGRLLHHLHDGFQSLVRQTLLEMVAILVCLLAFCHIIACCWYLVGTSSDTDGWVARSSYQDRGWVQQYVCALHWALTQFQGQMEITPFTMLERIFGEVVIVIALLSTSLLVAGITNSIIKVHNFYTDRSHRRKKLKQFLTDFNVSTPLVVQALRSCVELEDQSNGVNADECLHLVPHKLRLALRCDIFMPFIRQHPFFRSCELRTSSRWLLKAVCKHVLQHRYVMPDEVVFDQGLAAESAYVIMRGNLDYVCNVGTFTVCPGEWVRDAALWVPWNNIGRLATLTHGQLFVLNVKDFAALAQSRLETHQYAASFARRFLREVQRLHKSSVTDLVVLTRVSFLQRLQGRLSVLKHHYNKKLSGDEEENEHSDLDDLEVAKVRTLTRNRSSTLMTAVEATDFGGKLRRLFL